MKARAGGLCALAAAIALCGCARDAPAGSSQPAAPPSPGAVPARQDAVSPGPVQIEMKNVRLHLAEDLVVDVRHLRGEMISRTPAQPPIFDNATSYVIDVSDAEIAIDMANLSSLMNHHVFGYQGAPLSDLTVSIDKEGRLEQKGKLHKGMSLPFSMKAMVEASEDGRLRMKADSIKVAGVPAKGLMDLIGLSLEDVVKLKDQRGLQVENDTLLIAPGQILPPPEIRGRLANVSIAGNALVQRFAAPANGRAAAALTPPEPRARNYIYFAGNVLRFGKLTMTGADLQLIDADPSDAFDFYPEKYATQLTAGYSITTAKGGLKTFMPDYDAAVSGKKATPSR